MFPFLLSFCYPNRSYNRGILCLLPLLTKRSSATGSRDGTILVEEALSYQFKESCFSLFFPLPRNSFSVLLGKVPKNYQWLFSFFCYFIYSSRSTFFVLPFQYFYLLYPCFFFKGPIHLIEVYTGLNPYPSYHIYYYPTLLIVIFFFFLFLVGLAPQLLSFDLPEQSLYHRC